MRVATGTHKHRDRKMDENPLCIMLFWRWGAAAGAAELPWGLRSWIIWQGVYEVTPKAWKPLYWPPEVEPLITSSPHRPCIQTLWVFKNSSIVTSLESRLQVHLMWICEKGASLYWSVLLYIKQIVLLILKKTLIMFNFFFLKTRQKIWKSITKKDVGSVC